MNVHKTVVKCDGKFNETFPVSLREAFSILVEERSDMIPTYLSGNVNCLEELDSFEGKLSSKRGSVKSFVEGLKNNGDLSDLLSYVVYTDDLLSSNPAIKKSDDPTYSFQIDPKEFYMGLTGRILNNGDNLFEEGLFVETTVYDAYNTAMMLNPERISIVKGDGTVEDIYKKDLGIIGKKEKFSSQRKPLVLRPHPESLIDVEVLDTSGLEIVDDIFFDKLQKKYGSVLCLFGHKYEDANTFFSTELQTNPHLILKLAKYDNSGGKIVQESEWEYHDNRFEFYPDKATLRLGDTYLKLDNSAGFNSMMALGDTLRDVWCYTKRDPRNLGEVDIIYDPSRGLYLENTETLSDNESKNKKPVIRQSFNEY